MDEDLDYSDMTHEETQVLLYKFGAIEKHRRLSGDRFIAWMTFKVFENSIYSKRLVDKGYFEVVIYEYSADVQLYFSEKGWKIANLLNSFSKL